MPLNSDGTWRPWNAEDREQVTRYFENVINTGGIDRTAAIFAAGAKFNLSYDYDRLAMYNYYRTAQRAVDAAHAANANPNFVPDPGDIPNASQDPMFGGLYVYEILVQWTNPVTGQVIPVRDFVTNPDPVSHLDIQAHVQATMGDLMGQVTNPGAAGQDMSDWNFNVTILSITRGV